MDHVAAFGIGSTNFRYAVASTAGEFRTDVNVEPTRPRELPAQLVSAIGELRAATSRPLDAVAISCTGLVDDPAGVIREVDTADGETIERVDVAGPVEDAHGLPSYLVNDCNAAALGEWHYGARTSEDCLAHVTVGTGIGGGIVERGRLLRGDAGQAGEFGLLPVAPSEYASTGVTGAWEAVCSGRGIPEFVAARAADDERDGASRFAEHGSFTAEDVFAAAADGDRFANACLDDVARYNAAGVGAVCNTVNPGLVTLGGGVALNNGEWILDGIERYLDDYCFVDHPEVRLSPLGDDIGLYGGLAAYGERSGESGTREQ